MKNILVLIVVCMFLNNNVFAQKINYKKFAATLRANSCGSHSHKDIEGDYHKFLLLDSSKISAKDKVEYYSDYGMSCYTMYCITKNKNFATQSNVLYRNGLLIDLKDTRMLWNYACNLIILGECDEAKKQFDLYLKNTPKKYITKDTHEQIDTFEKNCGIY